MRSTRESSMLASGRTARGADFSPLIVIAMLVVLGLVISRQVVPAYYEQQELDLRNARLTQDLEEAKSEALRMQDEIDALNDPYYVAAVLVREYNYRWDRESDKWRAAGNR